MIRRNGDGEKGRRGMTAEARNDRRDAERMEKNEINQLTEKIIGIAIKIHKKLGPGFVEKVYEKAMQYELGNSGIIFQNQPVIKIRYEDLLIGNQRVDFIAENEIIIELKSAAKIIRIYEAQLLSYLKTSGKRIGLILNFGRPTLEIKRMVYNL